MGIKGSQSTIDRNGNGGDCGVSAKREAIVKKLDKMHQTGMPANPEKAVKGVPGGHKPQ